MKNYFDIAGDGGSNVARQVADQRSRIARKLEGVRHMVAVGSGKGGVGKSTFAMQFAMALRAAGREVSILDADLNGPTQARLAGLSGTLLVPGADGLIVPRSSSGVGVISMGSVVPESEALDFDSVSEGESHTWRATREFTLLGELLEMVDWGRLDYLVFDLPPGAERTLQYAEFLGASVTFVVVTVPSDLSRGVVARSIAALRKTPNRLLGYVENMKGYYCECCGETRRLFPEAGEVDLDVPCLGSVPFDPVLAAACDRGESLGLDSERPAVRAISEIAARIERELEATS
jgi:ATP-binding protein involved in chromosome partitioning